MALVLSNTHLLIGLLGFGTVGSQVYQALTQNFCFLLDKTGFSYHVEKILVRDLKKIRNVQFSDQQLTTHAKEILENPDIQLVVEVIGGIEPARTYIETALNAGKSVITANKAVMATHGEELLALAARKGVDLFFEASVAGAIPILRSLRESLATDRILEIIGIVNGTTNYILTEMTQEGSTYEKALSNAQKLGYAEPDPTLDVTGMDAAYKIAILAFLAFGSLPQWEQVYRQGITEILPVDIQHAKELGYRIKLVSKACCNQGLLFLSVVPTLIPLHHPLIHVEGAYNAILVKGERFGNILFHGEGAGGVPTSAAIVSDIVQATKNLTLGMSGKSTHKQSNNLAFQEIGFTQCRFYLRIEVEKKPNLIASLKQIFAEEQVSLSEVIQKGVTEIILLTHPTLQTSFGKALKRVQEHPWVKAVQAVLHVE